MRSFTPTLCRAPKPATIELSVQHFTARARAFMYAFKTRDPVTLMESRWHVIGYDVSVDHKVVAFTLSAVVGPRSWRPMINFGGPVPPLLRASEERWAKTIYRNSSLRRAIGGSYFSHEECEQLIDEARRLGTVAVSSAEDHLQVLAMRLAHGAHFCKACGRLGPIHDGNRPQCCAGWNSPVQIAIRAYIGTDRDVTRREYKRIRTANRTAYNLTSSSPLGPPR